MDEGCSLGRVWQGYHCTWWTGRAVQAILALVDSLRDRIPVDLCCGLSPISHWDPSLPIVHTADMSACPCAPVHSQLHTSFGSRGEMERTSTPSLETHRWLSQPLVLAWRQDAHGSEQGSKVKQSSWKALFLFFFYSSLCTLPCRYE